MPKRRDNVSRNEKTSAGGWDHPAEAGMKVDPGVRC